MRWVSVASMIVVLATTSIASQSQTLPATVGETLSSRRIVLSESVRGHSALLIASFSRDAGSSGDEWAKAAGSDPALAGVSVYQIAMLERAPGFIRGTIKSSMRRQTPAAAQDHFIVFTEDEGLWRTYFGVTTDKDAWIVLIAANGQTLWHGHGSPGNLEPLLKAALRQ
jgi:hypothetical protein